MLFLFYLHLYSRETYGREGEQRSIEGWKTEALLKKRYRLGACLGLRGLLVDPLLKILLIFILLGEETVAEL